VQPMLLVDQMLSRYAELVDVLVEDSNLDLLSLALPPRVQNIHPPAPFDALLLGKLGRLLQSRKVEDFVNALVAGGGGQVPLREKR
jgi:hypothetical protein